MRSIVLCSSFSSIQRNKIKCIKHVEILPVSNLLLCPLHLCQRTIVPRSCGQLLLYVISNSKHLLNGYQLVNESIFCLQRGTVIRYNHIHHNLQYYYGADVRGVMLDDQYSSVLVEKNVFYNVRSCRLYQHKILNLHVI